MRLICCFVALFLLTGCSSRQAEPAQSGSGEAADAEPAGTVQAAEPDSTGWRKSAGRDDYDRVLAVRTNRFGGRYAAGQPVPVSVEILNLTTAGPEHVHPQAQLFPHLDVWVERGGVRHTHSHRLKIENRIRIEPREKFAHVFDLADAVDLSEPGLYHIAVGHWNGLITDLGDWTGTAESAPQAVEVVPESLPGP